MTRHPPQPLDAEERALAALLARPHGRGEPGADLDARILAAAQAALLPQPAVRRPRRSWIGPTALAASLVLAMGLAWQLRPPPALPAPATTEDAASADSDDMSMRDFETPPSTPAPTAQAKPMPAPPPPEASAAAPARDAPARIAAPASAPVAAAPPAPPASPAPVMAGEAAAVTLPQVSQPARAQAPLMGKASASDALRERAAASGNAAETREEAQRAADTGTLDAIDVAGQEEDVPPATADSPDVRDAWLRRIGELLEQGRTVEARASLAEFRRRYPDAILPEELRKLEP